MNFIAQNPKTIHPWQVYWGLLWREWRTQRFVHLLFLVLFLILHLFSIVNNSSALFFFFIIYSGFACCEAGANDNEEYDSSLPFSRRQLYLSRFIAGFAPIVFLSFLLSFFLELHRVPAPPSTVETDPGISVFDPLRFGLFVDLLLFVGIVYSIAFAGYVNREVSRSRRVVTLLSFAGLWAALMAGAIIVCKFELLDLNWTAIKLFIMAAAAWNGYVSFCRKEIVPSHYFFSPASAVFAKTALYVFVLDFLLFSGGYLIPLLLQNKQ